MKVLNFGVVCNDTVWFATYGVTNVLLQASRPWHVQPLCHPCTLSHNTKWRIQV